MYGCRSTPARLRRRGSACGGGGDALLAGAGLRDDSRLPHALRDQRLADGVIDLVRAGVIQILALEKQPERAAQLRELRRFGQRRRATDIVGENVVELAAECAIAADLFVRALEFVEGGHQRLGDELAAE